jgi:hypothetical protein
MEGARILVGEEVRSLSATVAEAGGGADDGWRRDIEVRVLRAEDRQRVGGEEVR